MLTFRVQNHVLLLRPHAERFYLLNPTAALLWALRDSGADANECACALVEAYGIPEEHARRDVAATFTSWEADGLLATAPVLVHAPHEAPERASNAVTRHYRIGNSTFSVTMTDAGLQDDLPPRIAHFEATEAPEGATDYQVSAETAGYALYRDGDLLDTVENIYAARTVLLFDVLRSAYAAEPWCANLHAGVIGANGRCVVVAGASGAGKSTLSVAARLAGLEVLGDDAAPILEYSGHVAATPLATMLREGSWPLFEGLDAHYTISEIYERDTGRVRFLAPRATQLETRKATALLLVRREAGCTPRLQQLDTVEALQRFAETGFWVRPDESGVHAFLCWLERVPKFDAFYETTQDGVTLLRQALGE